MLGHFDAVPEALIRIFNADPQLIEYGVPATRIYFCAFFAMFMQMVGQTSFVALGKARQATFFSLLRKAFIVVPLALLLPRLTNLGVFGVFIAEPISDLVGSSCCFATFMLTVYRKWGKRKSEKFAHNTIVVGSGAAALSAAERLSALGVDAAIVTEGMNRGTSRNTGSDKQTYYKLTLSGNVPDSPADMAADLFAGQCVDGDVALCEAALSTRAFLRLCELGVPFPVNRYGEFVGYKTDHDPRARATSAGPLTSRLMTGALERAVKARGVPVYDGYLAVRIVKDGHGAAAGVLALGSDGAFARFAARNVVWATGGPAGIYENTVYPAGHFGMSGAPLMAGALGRNLTEWQYGLASVHPRWNVSGTYMQVLPRFFSLDEAGQEHDFLQEAFKTPADCLLRVFLKGYEWPFDCRKAELLPPSICSCTGKHEKRRRVFLDYRANPYGGELDFSILPTEAREYLENAGALFGKPSAGFCT